MGKKIRKLRREQEMSQMDLALRAGISRPTVARLEAGIVTPSLETAKRVADALGVTVDDLIEKGPVEQC